jgi:eukaryotic-like serine/threonine-protein kinase
MSQNSTPERWLEVLRLFDGALELPEEQRAAFVAQAADGDAALAAEVRALLEAEERSRNFFEANAVAVHEAALDELVTEPPPDDGAGEAVPRRIGRYRVIAELGRGGWGTVYHAERDTGDFEQRVAIKVLRRGLDTDDVLARFRAEGRILARLDHPGIARLLDGGATDDGRPFLTMELVDGQPITEYCRQRSLDVAARLRLFLDVARAVEYAHRNLVVHRDLKPSNILVSADGQVKLLDFGIAKLLGDEVGEDPDTPHTRTGLRPMTPEYASPEQVRGEPITTASDVYQLGLLLYELLTGFRPYAASESSADRRAESLREEPTAPSAAVLKPADASDAAARDDLTAARRVGRLLRGDLDTIVLKALRRDSRHR